MMAIPEIPKNIKIDLLQEAIHLNYFFELNESLVDTRHKNILNRLYKITVEEGLIHQGAGHTCIVGEPTFDNNTLSRRRIRNLYGMIKQKCKFDGKKSTAVDCFTCGTCMPYKSSSVDSLNRRATIQFFEG